jgi:hypothetical protein
MLTSVAAIVWVNSSTRFLLRMKSALGKDQKKFEPVHRECKTYTLDHDKNRPHLTSNTTIDTHNIIKLQKRYCMCDNFCVMNIKIGIHQCVLSTTYCQFCHNSPTSRPQGLGCSLQWNRWCEVIQVHRNSLICLIYIYIICCCSTDNCVLTFDCLQHHPSLRG